MEVVKDVEKCWEVLGYWLGVQWSKRQDIKALYPSDHQRMKAMIVEYVKYNLTPSWKEVAIALQKLELNQLADEVTIKFVKGTAAIFVGQLILKSGPTTIKLLSIE